MSLTPYFQLMRLHRPAGIALLFWPVCAALLQTHAPFSVWLLFMSGVLFTRSAGCIVNDLWDRNFDQHVQRTLKRPLASGLLSRRQALLILGGLLLALTGLFLQLKPITQAYALLATFLTVIYPLFKRFFPFPQLILGITFNMGVLMVFSEMQNAIPPSALALYAASICWTFAYDTAYALADQSDDRKLGLHSSAITLANYTRPCIMITLLMALIAYFMALAIPLPEKIGIGLLLSALVFRYGWPQLRSDPLKFFYQQAIWGGAVIVGLQVMAVW